MKKSKTSTVKKTKRRSPTARPSLLANAEPINPDFFYRKAEAWKFFGYKPTQLDLKIKSGAVPMPVALDPDDGRATGWYGRTILAHQATRIPKPAHESVAA